MSIYHLSMKPISRASGRSAVAAVAYRAADRLENARDGMVHDFTRKAGVAHAEIVLPGDAVGSDGAVVRGAGPGWARHRSGLWNAAEAAERRKDARVAREIEISLPHELSADQRLALVRDFVCALAAQYGVAVDFAIHTPQGNSDIRNHHAHLLMTTRQVGPDGLGQKSLLELENKKLVALGLPTTHEQLRDIRVGWEARVNAHLARAGLDIRVDHRSHQECGLEIDPTEHVGVHSTQMGRRGKATSRSRLNEATARRNAASIIEKPEQVLSLITNEKSVFDRRDIARTLHRAVNWGGDEVESGSGAELFQLALAKVMASPALVMLQAEQRDERGAEIEAARYSTREMIAIERAMADSADRMAEGCGFFVSPRHIDAAVARQDGAIRRAGGDGLAPEQVAAIEHVCGPERISVVVGLAGAGKSTLLSAAREAWQAQGFQVHGAALAGKAAEGLEESSGIASHTLASWERSWERGFDTLGSRSVFVIDEAGMVGSKQLSRFITEADRAGAKIVLVGDPEQLQPIGAGAAFRAVAERVGFVELEGVRRQREGWQRAASVDFGRYRTVEGLRAYADHGAVRFEADGDEAGAAIVRDVLADMEARPDGSRLVLAHRRADVQGLNEAIRSARQARGELGRGVDQGEIVYRTTEGERAFAPGDRVLFRENSRELGVKNGMLGTVERAEDGHLAVRLDFRSRPGQGRAISVSMADYAAVDHGYATTIHKSQGATVDRAFVLASGTMDRHLTYVAMTRHRDGVTLYADREEFADMDFFSARLSRSNAKETTLDYEGVVVSQGAQQEFAARRGFYWHGERAEPEVTRAQTASEREQEFAPDRESAPAPASGRASGASAGAGSPRKGRFAGLRLGSGEKEAVRAVSELERIAAAGPSRPVAGGIDPLVEAVERYAVAWSSIDRMKREDLPILEGQSQALELATAGLDAVRPGAVQNLRAALRYDAQTRAAMSELVGPTRGAALVAGIEREAVLRADPRVRAGRYVADWNRLEASYRQHDRWDHRDQSSRCEQIAEQLARLAGVIGRDRKALDVLASDPGSFEIKPDAVLWQFIQNNGLSQAQSPETARDIARELEAERGIQPGRSAGPGMGLSM
jgi:Ti-type conjugative transfer relaxase TraA